MNFLSKLNQTLGFTPTEGRVVIFLVASFVIGLGIKLARETTAGVPVFDYAAADSEFAARSAPLNADSTMQDDTDSTEQSTSSIRAKTTLSHLININTATKEELALLPGIGEAMAERIVAYRNEHGSFLSVNELMKVKGIGKKKFERILQFLYNW